MSLAAGLLCASVLASFPATAHTADLEPQIRQTGRLPAHGRAVIRSGLAWMDENNPTFRRVAAAFSKELTSRGMTVVPVRASALEPMPKTPLPNKQAARNTPAARRPAPDAGVAEEEAAQKASELGKAGKLPPLKLRIYNTPGEDTDLPDSVRAIAAPDVTRALYARSQEKGKPVVHTFAIPGRLPKELTEDATIAEYAFIIRFAAVRTWASAPGQESFAFGPGVLVAAATIGGTGRLGFNHPAQAAPPGQNTYGTPGGYARGYEGSAPNDFWHRDNDFYQRDYQFKHGPQPQYATPPTGLSGDVTHKGPRGFGMQTLPGRRHGPSSIGWHMLILDCFDLAPIRTGGKPVRVWQAVIRSPGDTDDIETATPKMIRLIFAAKQN